MCIDDTPYVCSHIISLSTPTIAGVTKIALRERVPNGARPKLGRVLTPLWGRTTPSSKKRRLRWGCASLFHQLLCHHENMLLPWVVLIWQTLYRKELLAKQDNIAYWYYWTRLLISSFAGCKLFLCAWTHILFPSSRAWSHLRCMPMELLPASQYVFINGVRAWTYMEQWCHQQHLITTVTLRDYLHWMIKSSLFVDWWYTWTYISLFMIIIHLLLDATSMFLKSFCVDEHIRLSAASLFLKSHCAWIHTVWIKLLIEMLSFMIDEDTPCA